VVRPGGGGRARGVAARRLSCLWVADVLSRPPRRPRRADTVDSRPRGPDLPDRVVRTGRRADSRQRVRGVRAVWSLAAARAPRKIRSRRRRLSLRLVEHDDRLAIDGRLIAVRDRRAEPIAVLPEVLDDLAFGGHAVADAYRVVELLVLREIDDESGQARECGADEAGDERSVGDALAEHRAFGVLIVEVERVGVAAGLGERLDIVVGESLRERDSVADSERVAALLGEFDGPLRPLLAGGDPFVGVDAEGGERGAVG